MRLILVEDVGKLEVKIEILEREVSVVNQQVTDHDQKFGEFEANSSATTATLQQAIARISELDTKNNALEEKNNSSEETINSLREQINLLHAQINSSEAKINLLEAKSNSLEAKINLVMNQSRSAHGSRQSMFSSFMSLCMNFVSLKVIGFGCVLVPLAIALSSVDFGSKWTWFGLFSIIAIGIYAYILYQKAKESHAAWLTQLNNWWDSATTYFQKKDDDINTILASTIQIFGTTQMILLQVPETQRTLREAIGGIGQFAVTMTEYTRRLGDETSDCIADFQQQMNISSRNLNRLLGKLTNTAEMAGTTIERAENNLNWQVGDFLERICGSANQFSNEIALNANSGREVVQVLAQNFCQAICYQFGDLVNGVNRGIENGQFQPYVNAPVNARANVPVKISPVSIF
ncbi:hypothetical protein Ddc_21873 [Ditylenchus destructor]|nr:hypothetical protein Ddc_21873 [Ditylenchus destructor]